MTFPEPCAYRLLTERLELRCYEPEDAEELMEVSARNKDHLARFLSWGLDEPQTIDEKLELIRMWRGQCETERNFVYRVQRREDPRLIGGTGLHPRPSADGMEIGYWMDQDEGRQGFATELTAALTRFTLEVQGATRVVIKCLPENEASSRIPEKLGFHKDGLLRRDMHWPDEKNRDVVVWTLLPEELPGSPAASAVYEAFDDLGRPLGAEM